MSREVESLVSGFENAMGAIAFAGIVGMAQGRARAADRRAREARCDAAARAAEGEVYAATAAQLRERLADAEEDVVFLREENEQLRADLDTLCAWISEQKRAGKLLA